MEVKVALVAFGTFKTRTVDVPENEIPSGLSTNDFLEKVFRYGQNDFQPKEGLRSVSVGDIIFLPLAFHNKVYKVQDVGFKRLFVEHEPEALWDAISDDARSHSERITSEYNRLFNVLKGGK